jgi:hypothetical protein
MLKKIKAMAVGIVIAMSGARPDGNRYTNDYLPEAKEAQNIEHPGEDKQSYDNPVTGFGFYNTNDSVESYLIFKDNTRSSY